MDLYKELLSFFEDLKEYKNLLGKSRPPKKKMKELREKLVRKSGQLSPRISELTKKQYVERWGRLYDVWSTGLTANPSAPINSIALDYCVDATNEAIGKLEKEGASWGALNNKRGREKAIIEAPQDYEEKAASKELELILEGTPDMILECTRSTVEKLNSQGYTYGFHRTSGAPDYARWDKTYFASCAISQSERQIGIIKLELLPNERTLFKIPEPEDWDSSFGEFISHLLAEFKRLGFLYFEEEKPPMGFRLPHKEKNV